MLAGDPGAKKIEEEEEEDRIEENKMVARFWIRVLLLFISCKFFFILKL
jgi:hypothetical protein